ncbi:MAG: pyridoxal-phosphate dependent enzyme [bacterium]|nr:pyridoxal-phosphate dependent enzyme [bacterium]
MKSLPRKLDLAQKPTPLQKLPHLSREWGVDLRVKRDDLTGAALSGNKIRKLEYLLGEALDLGCDTVITCGAVTSNHARATALAARGQGLDSVLVLAGDEPEWALGNLQLDLLAGAEVRYITRQDYSARVEIILEETAEELRRAGKKPYVIPTGGSNEVGLLGYVDAVEEMLGQCGEQNWRPDAIVCAVGSGGTYAGLSLGCAVHRGPAVWGVLVCGSVATFTEKAQSDIDLACERFSIDEPVDSAPRRLVDGYIAGGYALTNSEQLNFLRKTAQTEALILDPVYTNKAFFGLHGEIQAGRLPAGSNVLFVHTGGIFGLSAFGEAMTREWGGVRCWTGA